MYPGVLYMDPHCVGNKLFFSNFRARVVVKPRSTRASRQRIQASKLLTTEQQKQEERESQEARKEWVS